MYQSISNWLRKNDLWVFFTMTFVLMWPRSILGALYSQGFVTYESSSFLTVLYLIGLPMIAALIVTVITRGSTGIKDWAGRIIHWRFEWKWYVIALLLYPLVTATAYAISYLIRGGVGRSIFEMWRAGFANIQTNAARIGLDPQNTGQILVVLILTSILVALFEEGGWRAYAIPRMQERMSPLASGVILGVIWALWHIPAFYTVGSDQYGMPFAWFFVTILCVSILMVWMMNRANQSALATILFHGSIILAGHVFPTQLAYQTGDYLALWLTATLLTLVTLIVIIKDGLLSRGVENNHP